jgi:uncharacterized cupredoxin-like copper-binding protein
MKCIATFRQVNPEIYRSPPELWKSPWKRTGSGCYCPSVIEVRLGEQVRFLLFNEGAEYHEFVLATHRENQQHAELMKKSPNMEHNDPNAKRLSGLSSGELLWKFTRRGQFEYACLIPGHFQAGMHGKIIVK